MNWREKTKNADRRGVTLIETITVVGVMTIIMVVVSQVLVVNNQLVSQSLTRVDTDTGAVLAMRRFGELTRGASAVMASQVVNGTTYASDDSTLVLQLPTIDATGLVVPASYDYVAFYRDATETGEIWTDTEVAVDSIRPAGAKLLTAFNQTLVFRYNDPDVSDATRVSAYLVNAKTARDRTLTSKAWTSIFLRNR